MNTNQQTAVSPDPGRQTLNVSREVVEALDGVFPALYCCSEAAILTLNEEGGAGPKWVALDLHYQVWELYRVLSKAGLLDMAAIRSV